MIATKITIAKGIIVHILNKPAEHAVTYKIAKSNNGVIIRITFACLLLYCSVRINALKEPLSLGVFSLAIIIRKIINEMIGSVRIKYLGP
mgnify:CR=1 FL=1